MRRKSSQWAIGKNFDQTGALGPELVTPDETTTGGAGLRIVTGTPQGVGYTRKPPVFMKAGDAVEIEKQTLGVLRNTIVSE